MIGYDAVHPSDFVYDVSQNKGYYLLILTSTPIRFRQDGVYKEYPANQAALFAPDSQGSYGACTDFYRNDWIVFSSDETYVTEFPLIAQLFPVMDPEYIHNLFKLLTWEHSQDNYETVISQLMSVLFQKLAADTGRIAENGYNHELLALRRKIMHHPREPWNVAGMAQELHISPGYLQMLYKKQFGISCMDDVIQSRIRLAKDYLRHTGMQISEIAVLCGYNSTEHFSRQFRAVCRMAPGEYRTNGRE